jgi:hypothetical protein
MSAHKHCRSRPWPTSFCLIVAITQEQLPVSADGDDCFARSDIARADDRLGEIVLLQITVRSGLVRSYLCGIGTVN